MTRAVRRQNMERLFREGVEFCVERRRWLAPLVGVLALNLLVYVGFTSRSGGRIGGLDAQLREAEGERQQARRELDKNDRKKALGVRVQNELKDLYDNILLEYDTHFPAVRLEIERIMGEAGVGASQISYTKAPIPELLVVEESISFPLKGDYHTLRKLISLIEQSPFFLIIDSVQLNDSNSEGIELNLNIRVITFFHDPSLAPESTRRRPA